MKGKLFVVGTPIGNLSDISKRAIETIASTDFIAAEDTRVTLKLLNHLNIRKELVSYFEHNEKERRTQIIKRILNGEDCVLVSDAGMPAVSDPGEELVKSCIENGIKVTVIPGPTALTAAIPISGLPSGRFTFEGFLSVNKKNRKKHLESLTEERRTMVFYEAPHKLKRTLSDLLDYLGNRKISIIREITKIHEEVIRTTLEEANEEYFNLTIKGEFVLVVEGKREDVISKSLSFDDAIIEANELIDKGFTKTQSAKIISNKTGIKRGEIYKILSQDG